MTLLRTLLLIIMTILPMSSHCQELDPTNLTSSSFQEETASSGSAMEPDGTIIHRTKYIHDTIHDTVYIHGQSVAVTEPTDSSEIAADTLAIVPGQTVQQEQRTNYVYSYKLSLILVGFAMMVVVLSAVLMWHKVPASAIMKVFGALVVLIGGLLLVVAGFSNDQITPVVGLFGTALGYLMSKGTSEGKQ